MAARNTLLGKLVTATKQFKRNQIGAPWNVLSSLAEPYDDMVYSHPFRTGTMPTQVKFYAPIVKAVEMFKRNSPLPGTDVPDYLMVSKNSVIGTDANGRPINGKEYFLEMLWQDGSAVVMHKKGAHIRISDMESDGTNNPCGEFKDMDEIHLAGIYLLCMPEILEADHTLAADKLKSTMDDFALYIPDFAFWATEADVPSLAKESAFYLDAILCYANDKAQWVFTEPSNVTASTADPVADTLTLNGFSGSVVACSNLNVSFRYCASNGRVDGGVAQAMTIADAKAEFSHFSAHRVWTQAEKMMIPDFAPTTPVPPEVLRMVRYAVGTRDAVNPMCNFEWRGPTATGKSYGVRMMAHILNMPLLILTCHPAMELSEFKSTFVPASEGEGLELDMSQVALVNDSTATMSSNLRMAIDHVSQMEMAERDAFLGGHGFFMTAMMDTEGAAFELLGKEMELEPEELCKLYTDTVCYFREKPLRLKIAHLETAEEEKTEQKEQKPGFKHVLSNYVKALVNGYIVEVQELSRVRDSGVAVGLNEYEHAGAVIHLMNGAMARRHKDAICVITDNVGYGSCRPVDQSVIRRQAVIIDTAQLSEQTVKDRVRRNTGCSDAALLNRCYDMWSKVKEYCEQNSITEGSVSPMELERLVQAVMLLGEDSFFESFNDCVISKATSSYEDQRDIRTICGLS